MALEPRNQVALSVPEVWRLAKPYQIEDCDFVVRNRRVVLGHQTGLGKTFISLLAWSKLPAYKTLIVGTLSSVYVWLSHLKDFAGIQPLVVQGRDPRWDVFLRGSEGVCLCTYATLRMLMSGFGRIRVDLLILDEIHRALRSRNTQIFRAVKRVDAQFVIGLSATWASRGPQDLWPMLNIISPKTFPSYWRFVETWCFVERGAFGVEVFGVRNAENLRTMLQSRYYRARKRSDVADQLGIKPGEAVVRQVVRLAMSPQQEALYRQLDSEMYVELGKERVVTPSVLAKLTRLMQLAISPATLFKGSEPGPAIEYVVDKIAEDRHVVVFCPFKSGLDVLSAQLASSLPEVQVFRLEGGTDPKIIDSVIRDWKESKGVMLCTIDFAQSFSLDTVETAYMLGFDWDPNDNLQAEGRLRRLNSPTATPCLVRYIVLTGTVYDHVKDVVNGKVWTTSQFLQTYTPGKPAS